MEKTAKKFMALFCGIAMGMCMQFSVLATENPFVVNDTDINVGSTELTVKIAVQNATKLDAYHFWIGYDQNVLSLKDESAYGYAQQFLDSYKKADALTTMNAVDGKVIFAGANAGESTYLGTIATVTFSVSGDTNTAAQAITALTFHLENLVSGGVDVTVTQEDSYSVNVISTVNDISGDVDGNGSVELLDAQMALKAALAISALDDNSFKRADVDNNNSIELSDAQTILKKALNIIS